MALPSNLWVLSQISPSNILADSVKKDNPLITSSLEYFFALHLCLIGSRSGEHNYLTLENLPDIAKSRDASMKDAEQLLTLSHKLPFVS